MLMSERAESVHVHSGDAAQVIEEYRRKGFVLKERTKPSIVAQVGFVKLIFVPADDPEAPKPKEAVQPKRRRFLF